MSKKDAIAAKFALGELTIEDLLPALRKISLISAAKKMEMIGMSPFITTIGASEIHLP